MKSKVNIQYGEIKEQLLDVHLPDRKVECVFLYLHGGGLERGDKSAANVFAEYLTERGVCVVSVDYRMYPSAKYPEFIEDARDAVAWTLKYMKESLGCDKLYVGGSSAGGYLSMMLCFNSEYLETAGVNPKDISGYFHDAGQPTAHFNVLRERGIDTRRVIVDEIAPLYYIDDQRDYPPMRFIVSDDDIKGRYEQIMLTLQTLSSFGYTNFDHVVMHGTHCHYCGEIGEDGESVFGKMIFDFLEKVSKM